LTNLLPAGLQVFLQVLNILNANPDQIPLGLNLGYSASNFLVPENQAHEDANTQ